MRLQVAPAPAKKSRPTGRFFCGSNRKTQAFDINEETIYSILTMATFKQLIAETRTHLAEYDYGPKWDFGDGDPDPNPEYQKYRSLKVDLHPSRGGPPGARSQKKQTQWTPEMLKKIKKVPSNASGYVPRPMGKKEP